MTKKMKKATTNKLILWYTNDTSYTIPRVENFTVARDGKSVSGQYTKTVSFHGITEEQNIAFTIDLVDVMAMSYETKHGDGRIVTVTEYRGEDDYYKEYTLSVAIDNLAKSVQMLRLPTNPFFDIPTAHIHKGNL
ncbi:hypothetical protein MYOV085v1_p0242 [Vibrio phage 355E48.1]|nr:hypothetical protein MYOV085v1_p0242 [Vibrio phage 355E48.1]